MVGYHPDLGVTLVELNKAIANTFRIPATHQVKAFINLVNAASDALAGSIDTLNHWV